MKTSGVLKLVVGLILVLASLYSLFFWPKWWSDFLTLLKGGIPIVIFLIGLLFLLLGFEE